MNKSNADLKQGLPEGTVTFLFTDIEGSTNLLRQLGDEYAQVLARMRSRCDELINAYGGPLVPLSERARKPRAKARPKK